MLHQIGAAQRRRTRDTADTMDQNHSVRLTGVVDELTGLFEIRDHVEGNIVICFQEEVFDMTGNQTASWWNEDYGENVCHFQTSQTHLGKETDAQRELSKGQLTLLLNDFRPPR